ncbi:MAG: hypothetical protein M3436_09490 [Pseudomonadota bacterium]|nr:hypothetical protein [Pseudomonadota bacterium]
MRPEEQTAIVVVPCFVPRLLAGAHPHPLGEEIWDDTRMGLPEGFHEARRNEFLAHSPLAQDRRVE